MVETLPRIVSVDDHILEPPTVWTDRLPAKYQDVGPRVVRRKGFARGGKGHYTFEESDAEGAGWADCWLYEDVCMPQTRGFSIAGHLKDADGNPVDSRRAVTFDDMLPGCYQQAGRLEDMDKNHMDASICFPTFARFCGQRFNDGKDRDLALLCVQAYNDFMIDEWCAGDAFGRLIPLTLIPLWDGELAAAEVRRCADKGSHAVAFSESPYELGLPSIHSGHWDSFIQACADTDTVINMHIGSSGHLTSTSPDAPRACQPMLNSLNTVKAFSDWIASGHLERHPNLKIALSEGQVGWIPFFLERIVSLWERDGTYGNEIRPRIPKYPTEYMSQIYGCLFDDLTGLRNRDVIGMDQMMFEVDYPHSDSTWPDSKSVLSKLVKQAGLSNDEIYKLVRGNAIRCYGLDKYFGVAE